MTGALFRGGNRDLAHSIIEIIDDLSEYWPLTVRQVYYQCVARLLVPNWDASYRRVSKILTTLRRHDLVTWDAVDDRSRRTTDKRGVSDLQAFVRDQTEYLLDWRYYHRCRVQSQDVYVEVITEKDALHPRDLGAMLEEALKDALDMESFDEQVVIEAREREKLKEMRRTILGYARSRYPALFTSG